MREALLTASPSTILVTGASGFIGSAVLRRMAMAGTDVRAAYRDGKAHPPLGVQAVLTGDLGATQDWRPALESVKVVVHAAARVHVMHDTAADPLEEFRRVNVVGTLNLARQAAAMGVQRFVFVSSVKVQGESTSMGRPFTERDEPAPTDPYGQSKLEAELGLRAIAQTTGMEIVVIRPPLVYGPGVRANFRALLQVVARGVPLPLESIDNRRSLVGLDNLVDFIVTCVSHPAAVNEVFLVSDGNDLSTPELVRRMAKAVGRHPRLFSIPKGLLSHTAALLGRSAALERLSGNLQVDIGKAQAMLGWHPPFTVDEQLARTAQHRDTL